MTLTLPWPPSVNRYYRTVNGRTMISAEGRAYRSATALCWIQDMPFGCRLSVELELHPPDNRRRDIDNVLKALLDAMQHAGVYEDDSQIDRLLIERGEIKEGGEVCVVIRQLDAAVVLP